MKYSPFDNNPSSESSANLLYSHRRVCFRYILVCPGACVLANDYDVDTTMPMPLWFSLSTNDLIEIFHVINTLRIHHFNLNFSARSEFSVTGSCHYSIERQFCVQQISSSVHKLQFFFNRFNQSHSHAHILHTIQRMTQ